MMEYITAGMMVYIIYIFSCEKAGSTSTTEKCT